MIKQQFFCKFGKTFQKKKSKRKLIVEM